MEKEIQQSQIPKVEKGEYEIRAGYIGDDTGPLTHLLHCRTRE